MVKAIILDIKDRYIKTLKGKIKESKFIYKEGWLTPIADFTCDVNNFIPIGKDNIFVYRFDGKDYTQIGFNNVEASSSIRDYIQTFKIAELQKNLLIQKPSDLKDLMQFVIILALAVMLGVFYFSSQNLIHQVSILEAPFNQSVQLQAQQNAFMQNEIVQLNRIQNQTLIYLKLHNP